MWLTRGEVRRPETMDGRHLARLLASVMRLNSVLITGAASGLGQALAIAYSLPGVVLHLGDRDGVGLDVTATQCRAAGAEVFPRIQDVTDAPGMEAWVRSCGTLDLVLGCAGVLLTSLEGRAETPEETRTTVAVNLVGALNTALPALATMAGQPADKGGVRGQIALLASLGAFVAVPGASTYCASKAGIDSWTVGRAAHARQQGVYLTSICPGPVRTPLTERHMGSSHNLMAVDEAARIIVRRLRGKPVRLAFPWRMVMAARFGGLLPAGFPARMLARGNRRRKRAS